MEYYSAIKKEGNNAIHSNMDRDLEMIVLSDREIHSVVSDSL